MTRPPRDRPHRALVDWLQRQDERAAAEILRRYGPMLRGFLADALDDAGAVEDVLQQTLVDVWRRGPSYAPERGSLATWLLMIARSRAIDHLRRRVPEPYDPADLPQPVDRAAESEIDALAERWRIAGLLAGLPREESTLLMLRFYEGLSQREISQRTGVALGTVKMRMASALERLRVALREEGA